MKILLIEPNRILAKQYVQFLENAGHMVVVRSDAQSAVMAADKTTPDVVVCEMMLAAHSGIEFLYEFRSYGEWLKIPVIILSRASKEALRLSDDTLKQLGIAAFLYKPKTSLARLLSVLELTMSRSA